MNILGGYKVILRVTTLVAITALAGCGGSNDGSATNPTTDTPNEITNIVVQTTYPNGSGIKTGSIGDDKIIWYDASLAVTENAPILQSAVRTDATLSLIRGDSTGYLMTEVIGDPSSIVPVTGSMNYAGPALMGYYQDYTTAGGGQGVNEYIEDATASVTINFNTDTGTYSLNSASGTAHVTGTVDTIYQDGTLDGGGTFTVDASTENGENLLSYSESSDLIGVFYGTNARTVGGVGVGDNHVISFVAD